MENKTSVSMVVGLLLILVGLAGILNLANEKLNPNPPDIDNNASTTPITPGPGEVTRVVENFEGFEKFVSEKDFKTYIEKNKESQVYTGGFGNVRIAMEAMDSSAPMAKDISAESGGGIERVSGTNVQVQGIDEPDIVKTNGEEIYLSGTQRYYRGFREIMSDVIYKSPESKTSVINANITDFEQISEIKEAGNLLLDNDNLIVFSGDKIIGYDVEDPEQPDEEWEVKLENNNYVVSARLYNNKIYLITRQNTYSSNRCPIVPMSVNGNDIKIRCTDIYHPSIDTPVDSTYTVLVLNTRTGKVETEVSFVGKASSSVIYMSENAIYVTYSLPGDFVKFFYNFLIEQADDVVDNETIEKIRKLIGYDISSGSKYNEMQIILENYYNSLDNDERLRVENELNNQLKDYYKKHNRELDKTGIVKISVDNLELVSIGDVPGAPLNQFSLDEYNNNLRIAVTIGQRWGRFGQLGESVSDVYVLDNELQEKGSAKGMGEGERIYSVRFLQDKGYVVTFRETDPFYVLDLSNPNNPEIKGELKIPGYSSYLHPITKDKILGIGKENRNVKISLFDVENPSKPKEADKYELDEYWSDVLNTHHAFLLDDKHEIFFMPGGRGGYIFSYVNDELKLEKAVSDISAKRALYINDYLYVIGENEIVILDEADWEEVNSLDLE